MSGEVSSSDLNPDEKDLSEDKKEKIKHLQEIVGGLDYSECIKVMEENEWNLEQAVHKIMDIPLVNTENSEIGSRSDQIVRRRNVINTTVDSHPYNQRVIRFDNVLNRNMPWYWQALYLLWSPFKGFFRLIWYIVSALRPDPRLAVQNPIGDVRKFLEIVDEAVEQTDNKDKPDFSRQTYGECVGEAKAQLRFLIVYMHDDTPKCALFLKHVLCSETLCRLIRDENVILWGCSLQTPEGYRVARLLRVNSSSLPFLGLIGPRLQTMAGIGGGSSSQLALLTRLEAPNGDCDPETLVRQLRQSLREWESPLIAARADRAERLHTQTLRRQQDIDYAESLRRDRQREAERTNAQKVLQDAYKEAAREKAEKEAAEKEFKRIREQIALKLPPERPEKVIHENSLEVEDTLLVKVLMPGNGNQLCLRFGVEDSIKMIYYHVMAQPDSPRNFQVCSNFPKRTWPCEPLHKEYELNSIQPRPRPEFDDPVSFKDFGVTKNIALFVLDCDA